MKDRSFLYEPRTYLIYVKVGEKGNIQRKTFCSNSEFVDPDGAVHNEPPHLCLDCFSSSQSLYFQ